MVKYAQAEESASWVFFFVSYLFFLLFLYTMYNHVIISVAYLNLLGMNSVLIVVLMFSKLYCFFSE